MHFGVNGCSRVRVVVLVLVVSVLDLRLVQVLDDERERLVRNLIESLLTENLTGLSEYDQKISD